MLCFPTRLTDELISDVALNKNTERDELQIKSNFASSIPGKGSEWCANCE